ncbi:MAG: 2-C-methyl-D-erythritol 4-phosphate cytidylyltransferase [Luteitalea sp.]|nr:2-C-methyl-D-erythritol 4-phosphate cytidylyltransferase [Luteitalea sp.]
MKVSVIIAAAGRGERLGGPVAKQWLSLGDTTLVEHSVRAFARVPRVDEILVVVPDVDAPEARSLAERPCGKPLRLVAGGARRQDSVANGFHASAPDADIVLVHDAARPFVTHTMIEQTIDAAAESGAAAVALAVHDTVKQASVEDGRPIVQRTLPRETIFLAQTPQGFRREVLAEAVDLGTRGAAATDEAGLAEQAGHRVRLVTGDAGNVKITTHADLARGRATVAPGRPRLRIGAGYDLHRLGSGRPLILGGVRIPFERGPIAHSDGDAVCHAVTDALLGAANLGDIGSLFPDTDPRWEGANSVTMLEAAARRVREAGWEILNIDVIVIAEQPKIGPHATVMRTVLADALGISVAELSIKGKTNEQVDATGRGEAIAVHAVALLAGC